MALNEKQQAVLAAVLRGDSVFYTGCAGTGKSYLLRAIVHALPPKTTWVTAMTGIAALTIGGRTLHSQAGIGMARRSAAALVDEMRPHARARWRECTTLIIDEVSMLSLELFEKLDAIARRVRCIDRPFGGIQLVLSGDFYQLPPVSQGRGGPDSQFCFESALWSQSVPTQIELTQVIRQTDDQFVALLQEVRSGQLSEEAVQQLKALERPLSDDDGIVATRLSPMNTQVDTVNMEELANIQGDVVTFTAVDYACDAATQALLDKSCLAPSSLPLKVGAQVMLLKNQLDERHVNGSRGVVVGFHPATKMPQVRFRSGSVLCLEPALWEYESPEGMCLATRSQVPLRLAWAVTVHKSQGLTIDVVEIDMARTFAYGQAYVALSRARTMDGLRVVRFHPSHVRTHPKVRAFVLAS